MPTINYEFKVDGYYDSVNYYRSLTPMDVNAMPTPTATAITGLTYSDTTAEDNKIYYVRFSSNSGATEKISEEISISTMDGYFNSFENGDNLQFFTGATYTADYSGDGVLISTSGTGNIIVRCIDSPDYYNFTADFYVTFLSGGRFASANLIYRNSEWVANYLALNYVLGVSRSSVWGYRRGSQFAAGNLSTEIAFNVRTKISVSAVDGKIGLFVNDVQMSDVTLSVDSYRGQFGFRFYCDGATSIRIEDLQIIEQ